MVLATKNPLNMLSTTVWGFLLVQLLVLGGAQGPPRALHCNVARILGADPKEVSLGHNPLGNDDINICYRNTYHHFGSFLWDLFLQIHPRHLSFSLSLYFFFFVARKAPSVALSHSFSIPPGQITQYWSPLISLLWGTVVVPPETLKPGFHNHQPLSVNNIWGAGSIKCSLMA